MVGLSRPLNHGVDSVADRRWLAEVRRSEDNLMALWDRHSQGAKLKYHFYRGQHILRMLIMEFSADPRLAYFLEVDNSEGGQLSRWANNLIDFYHLPYSAGQLTHLMSVLVEIKRTPEYEVEVGRAKAMVTRNIRVLMQNKCQDYIFEAMALLPFMYERRLLPMSLRSAYEACMGDPDSCQHSWRIHKVNFRDYLN